jgi:hypothetical protein
VSTSAAKRKVAQTRGNARTAVAHLSLEQLNSLARGEKISINLAQDDLVLELTSETMKDEIDTLFTEVDKTFTQINKSFKRIFGK